MDGYRKSAIYEFCNPHRNRRRKMKNPQSNSTEKGRRCLEMVPPHVRELCLAYGLSHKMSDSPFAVVSSGLYGLEELTAEAVREVWDRVYLEVDTHRTRFNGDQPPVVEARGDSIYLRTNEMEPNRYYPVEFKGSPYLYRKINDREVEVYGLADET